MVVMRTYGAWVAPSSRCSGAPSTTYLSLLGSKAIALNRSTPPSKYVVSLGNSSD